MKKYLLWLALSVVMPQILKAQTIDLVKDINTNAANNGITILETAAAGNVLFFIGSDGPNGPQLWKTDGTAAGTLRLTDSYFFEYAQPFGLTTANGLAFCQVVYGNDQWLVRSDGTISGTYPLQKNPVGLVAKNSLLEINGAIYYPSTGSNEARQLWKTNGTVAGTSLVKEFPGTGINSIGPFDFYNFNGVLYFLLGLRDGANTTYQLWKSDGTAAGTVPGPAFGSHLKPIALNGYMYYSENNTLKRTDGTTVTTIKNFTSIGDPTLVGTTIYFSAQDGANGVELWKSDGTTAGTVLVKDIFPGTDISSYPRNLTNVNGTLFFVAQTTAKPGNELFKSNGTAAGTVPVTNFYPHDVGYVRNFVAIGNQAVFSTSDEANGTRLWKSDGTSEGTQLISNIFSQENYLVNAGGTLYFASAESTVTRLYKSNLTSATTTVVPIPSAQGSIPQKIFDVNGTGYFTADNGIVGRELWKTNNTGSGTVLVKDINPGAGSSNTDQFTNVNGTLFFVNNAQEIWKSNGTSAGTVFLKDVISASNDRITGLIGLNNTLYFGVLTSTQTMQFWKSDGTAAGTVIITTFPNSNNFEPAVFNGQLYFLAWDGVNSYELWKSNGTLAGTSVVKDMVSAGGGAGRPVIVNNYIYYFLGDYGSISHLLIKSNGTAAGTTVVKNVFPDDDVVISELFAAGNLVYFSVIETDLGGELLWRSDGTDAGTFQLAGFDQHFTDDIHIRQKTDVGGKFFFVPYDNEIGDQLWVSDGTVAGTHMVKQIGQFADQFTIDQSAAVGNILYFTPHDESTGTELWRSDGTNDGTYLVYDLTTNGSTYFFDLANVNGTLLISANVEQYGAELYKYQPAPAALRINSGGAAFAASGSRNFSADQYFNGTTQLSTAASGDISNTTDDQLYKEQRFGSAFNYSIPVTNGPMNVVLHFAEIYWGVPGRGGSPGAGKRRFHVDIEGSRKLNNYDIFVSAGGAMRAKTETFTVNVTDGTLNIDFLTGAANNPIIAAIEVVPAGPTVLGPLADAYVRNIPDNNTNYGLATTLEVKSGSAPAYQRKTYLKFPLNGISQVSSARLRIYGSNTQSSSNIGVSAYGVNDDSWTETGITWNNVPASSGGVLGSINVNNTAKYYEIDVTAYVQSQLAGDKVVSLFVTNPGSQNAQLVFNSRENRIYRPQLVIETVAPPAARMAAEEELISSIPKTETSVIYPNPVVGKKFSVKVSERHEGNVDLQLINKTGQYLLIQKQPAGANSVVEVDASATRLSAGMYLLKIESKAHKEVVKMLVVE